MDYIVMADMVMADIGMADIGMAYIVMAYSDGSTRTSDSIRTI